MQDMWRIPFTAIMVILLVFSIVLGSLHSLTAAIFMGIGIWLSQGLCMWLVTSCIFPRLILTNWLSVWSDKILIWSTK